MTFVTYRETGVVTECVRKSVGKVTRHRVSAIGVNVAA